MAAAMMAVPLALAMAAPGKKPDTSNVRAGPVIINSAPISTFSKAEPWRTKFGQLTFLGGLVLTSPDKTFGGWSDIAVDSDGSRLLAVSDDGLWLSAGIAYRGGRIGGLAGAKMGPLLALSGRPLKGKNERDAEGLALVKGTTTNGDLLISFERIHRIGRFKVTPAGVVGPSSYIKLPPTAKRLGRNKGLESVTVLRGGPMRGAIVTFSERRRGGKGGRRGWIFHNGRTHEVKLSDDGDMDVTSAAGLPDGSLLVLERRFRMAEWFKGIRIRLRRISADEIRPGATLKGEVLLDASSANEIDNMEGLAVHLDSSGRTVVTMISDNNFNNFLQRTLLLQFALPGRGEQRASRAR